MRVSSSISFRLYAAALLVIASVGVLGSAIVFPFYRSRAMESLDSETAILGERLSLSLQEPLWSFSTNQVETILRVELKNPDVNRIVVRDENSRVFSGFEKAKDGTFRSLSPLASGGALPGGADGIVVDRTVFTELSRDGIAIGTVEIGLTFRRIQAESLADAMSGVTRIFVVSALGLLLVTMYMKVTTIDAIKSLSVAVRDFGQKNFTVRSGGRERKDEIGDLSSAFDRMADFVERYSTDLERLVNERTNQLVDAEKLAFLGGLVAGVAHEVNTPLGIGVTAASHLAERAREMGATLESGDLKRSSLDDFLGEVAETSVILLSNLRRASDFIRSFKQVAADQHTEDLRTIRVKEYFDEIVFTLRPKLKATPHSVTVDVDPELSVSTYPGLLSQIITNFIVNSIVHGYPGNRKGAFRIHARAQDGRFILEYSDDGCGIPPENLSRIFQPFFTTKRDRGGTGLGLYLVYNIVTRLGGTVRCLSVVDRGVRFVCDFPESPAMLPPEDRTT